MKKPNPTVALLMLAFVAFALAQTPKTNTNQQAIPAPPAHKRVQLSDVQFKMLATIEQEIEALPDVKALRGRQQGIIAGIATSNSMTRWRWAPDGKGGAYVEEVPEDKPQEGKP